MDAPRVWILCGDKAGDNAQLRAIGAALKESFGAELFAFELGRIGSSWGPGRWHEPTFDCRQCHGRGQLPLSHVDDGSNCNICHF